MADYSRDYLELLAEKYPSKAAACSEIINLRAILSLPKGTEHFISDLHGEYGAVRHILNNCSGVILEKVRRLFEQSNENTYVADSREPDSQKRIFRMRFNFKNKSYDKSKQYYLVVYDANTEIEAFRHPVIMDLAFAPFD